MKLFPIPTCVQLDPPTPAATRVRTGNTFGNAVKPPRP